MSISHPNLEALIATMATLRGEGGCPWDAEQTHQSLVPYLLEEVFELIEAIESGSRDDMREELGDVLYQLLFHADIATSHPDVPFTIDDVARGVDQKMRHRHPHVFGDGDASTVEEVVARWDDIKAQEKGHRTSQMDGIPSDLSALARAASVLRRSEGIVDAPDYSEVPAFADERELGQLLIAVVAAARSRGVNPESALRAATRDHESRVRAAEATRSGLAPGDTGA
jgi:XTP/dITP diphosphohydrolase